MRATDDDDAHGLPRLKPYRVFQVSTHGHDRPLVPLVKTWKKFEGVLHRDNVPIPPGGSWEFPVMEGPGKVVNIWCTMMPPLDFNPNDYRGTALLWRGLKNWRQFWKIVPFHRFPLMLKGLWIRAYFDGESKPSVDAPIGDFFGVGFGEYKPYKSRYLMETAGGFVCQFHMPFRRTCRVQIVNKIRKLWEPAFYGAVTFLRYPDDSYLEGQAYFNAKYRKEFPTTEGKPYLILDTAEMGEKGQPGHFAGVVLNTECLDRRLGFLFLEGNTKFYVDDEEEPSLEYTGLEDYYQGAWYYTKTRNRRRTEFSAPYHGVTVKSFNRRGQLAMLLLSRFKRCRVSQYRFHPEGIPFSRRLRVTCHHGEFDEVPGNYSSVAYWYQGNLV
ncbi:MAG: hypothetical protein Kow0069_13710 [Promethearchaeota archaeon]